MEAGAIRQSIKPIVDAVKKKYPQVHQDQLRRILKDVLCEALEELSHDHEATAATIMSELDRRVNEEVRS